MPNKPHGLEDKHDKDKEVTEHFFMHNHILNLERRIVILEQKSEELLKESQELQARKERDWRMAEWLEK